MNDTLTNIHPEATKIFNSQLASGNISHAYLLSGSVATLKEALAYALAKAIVSGATCISLDTTDIKDGTELNADQTLFNADLQVYAPAGARGYLAEQIRDIIADASRAPIGSKYKVNILTQADKLTTATANAFLKTLEEPPNYVVNILLADSVEAVLPTIVSRCQVVTLSDIARNVAREIVVAKSGASDQDAGFVLQATHGNISDAVAVLQDQSMLDLLEFLKRTYGELVDEGSGVDLPQAGRHALTDWDILQKSAALQKFVDDSTKSYKAELDAKLEEKAEFLEGPALKSAEKAVKRQVSARQLWILRFVTSVICVLAEADLKSSDALDHKNLKQNTKLIDDLFLLYDKLSYNISVKNYCDVLFLTIVE